MPWIDDLPGDLPDGRLVTPRGGDQPVYWMSSKPVGAGEWTRWRQRHARTGLWPILVMDCDDKDDPFELDVESASRFSAAEKHEATDVLGAWWHELVTAQDDEGPQDLGYLAPFGPTWPGPCPPPEPQESADSAADRCAEAMRCAHARLMLVPAATGADVLTAIGWTGAANYDNDTGRYVSVLRDWQERFAGRVVGLGFDQLQVSVAAPPAKRGQCLRVAAEHFAFCADSIWQSRLDTVEKYAESVRGGDSWYFWWD